MICLVNVMDRGLFVIGIARHTLTLTHAQPRRNNSARSLCRFGPR